MKIALFQVIDNWCRNMYERYIDILYNKCRAILSPLYYFCDYNVLYTERARFTDLNVY